jgi:hypothetical protein
LRKKVQDIMDCAATVEQAKIYEEQFAANAQNAEVVQADGAYTKEDIADEMLGQRGPQRKRFDIEDGASGTAARL